MRAGSDGPAPEALGPSDILAGIGQAESCLDRTVEANKHFKEGLTGTLEEKQETVAAAMKRIGPPVWRTREKLCRVLPCETCEDHCVQAEHAVHDIVNVKTGKPLFDPDNLAGFKRVVCAIPVPGEAEALSTKTATTSAESKMAFTLKGRTNELVRLYAAGSVGGGVGFALVDHFLVQNIPAPATQNLKDGVHAGIGVILTLLGAAANRLWLAELGASYAAVPVARLTERNALGGIPTGAVRFASPAGFMAGAGTSFVNGRTGGVTTPITGAKTF